MDARRRHTQPAPPSRTQAHPEADRPAAMLQGAPPMSRGRGLDRRRFLAAAGLAALGLALPVGPGAPPASAQARPKRLVLLFLRGGLDGLSALVPYEDRWYYQSRPSIALPPPGREGGCLPLAPGYGLHPALEPLLEPWREQTLAIVPSCGLPQPMRTHPEAQRAMESGQPGERHLRDGWMARLAQVLGKEARGLTLAPNPTLIGQGSQAVVNSKPTGFPPSLWKLERPGIFASFDAVYAGGDPLSRAYRQSQIVLRNELAGLDREIAVSASGAPSIHALPALAGQIAAYLEKNPATRMVFSPLGGFDAHFQQGASTGRLAEALASLGKGLAALSKALGQGLLDTCVLVMSEFGRSLRENEYQGTQNGHGTLCMVLGGNVSGGRLVGPWPGLSPEKLSDGLDPAAAVDFREVLAQALTSHMGLSREQLATVLPGYMPVGTLKDLFRS